MMDGLSAVVLLALLALGNAALLTTATQIPRTDEDVFREAVTDGFIVVQSSLTTQAPQNQTATWQSTTTTTTLGGEESTTTTTPGGEESTTTTTPGGEESTTTTTLGGEEGSAMGESPEEQTTTGATRVSAVQSTAAPSSESEDRTPTDQSEDKTAEETTTTTTTTTTDFWKLMSDSGSGEEETTTTLDPDTEKRRMFNHVPFVEKPPTGATTPKNEAPQHQKDIGKPNGHVTPEWIIIVGFLVGLAVLVLIFVAIATRDKWNGPDQFNQTGVTLAPDHQQGKAETEDLLHKTYPKENGKAEEYTVIPLDELPNSHLS
ncbi:uncharacterized protein [Eucyclogobius newberryi]|uniref:uncharacterized protein n=1 Tax=Eucyclogobius newberryi TaxID=166745 RepID=UPI003B5CB791